MKKLIPALIIIFTISTFSLTRPTNEWLIIFDQNQQAIIEADNIDQALFIFRREYKARIIYSAARRSYVESIWIK